MKSWGPYVILSHAASHSFICDYVQHVAAMAENNHEAAETPTLRSVLQPRALMVTIYVYAAE